MKAIVYHEYGSPDVLRYEEIEKPVPKSDEVLIRVRAASVNPYDWHFMRGAPYFVRLIAGLRKPKSTRLGADVAGEVESAGSGVAQFKPGDLVFGTAKGSFAEYVCVPETAVVLKPERATFEQAAAVGIAGLTALQGLRDSGRIQPGQRVLINGAAGGVGTFAVQIAKSFGAEVTGVCSTRNVEMVCSIGADRVIDYTREDFTKSCRGYDLFLDCIGNHSLRERVRVLNSKGTYVVAGARSGQWGFVIFADLFERMLLSWFVKPRMAGLLAKARREDLEALRELIDAGKVMPVIDRSYVLREVPEAIRYLEEGHARGKVAITVE